MMERSKAEQEEVRDGENSAQQPTPNDPEHTAEALASATRDIARDPDFAPPSKNDDLDEGETARLGDERGGLV